MKRLILAACLAATATLAWAQLPATHLRVVGGGSHNYTFSAVEQPFWRDTLPGASGGRVTAELVGLSESGLKGPEVVRLLRAEALDVAMGVFAFVSGDDAGFEGVDLPGMAPDIETAHKMVRAYRPVLAARMRERHGVRLLATVPYTAQVFFCREPVTRLEDLKGRKVRTRGRNMSDFVSALGASPVTIAFAEVIPALQTGVVDCAVSGIGSGNAAKWYDVAKHLYNLPTDWSIGFYAMSEARWRELEPAVQQFLQAQAQVLENRLWDETARENAYALACNTGQGECRIHTPADMQARTPEGADREAVRAVAAKVAAAWGERCGQECKAAWNGSAGKALGVTLP
ncbi:TRAP transporter substrate-binding protein [Orrella dioscoreae]|uniref:TRAP-type C4-dicarboxylate transport system, periplasmic component n=2 Tax=root TaxID=1 RepID=A0A1C3K257_9BURK|nr:TRAP transporter substrate-binding protein [Orrella dioscoreae]SBT25581.1 TRAP transporter solute receptor, unknown substrate 7 [Orrella dioscoreae]SOE51023.1 TRAP transporter solute receptor, unknown substrate 7 [Orrella dioscoreae]